MTKKDLPAQAPGEENLPNVSEQVAEFASLRGRVEVVEDAIATSLKGAPMPAQPDPELPEGTRIFVAPADLNGKFLVVAGKVVQVPSPNGPWDKERVGDVFAQFSGGILMTDNAEVIAWCEKSRDICRDAFDPQTEAWAALRTNQLETSTKTASIRKDLNVQDILDGKDTIIGDAESLVARARAQARIGR
jgi:hypothetical protein